MKTLIISPLYPPDTADIATYTKHAADSLSKEHAVTVLTYGHMPEELKNVSLHAITRSLPKAIRTLIFTRNILKYLPDVDCIYVQNGPAVELPMLLATFFTKKKIIIHIGDKSAYERSNKKIFTKFVLKQLLQKAKVILTETPPQKPEILPFEEHPEKEIEAYEKAWATHLKELVKICNL